MAVDQSTDDSLCMMLFHTKVFALCTEHVCESIAKSLRTNTAYMEINSHLLKSLCPSQKQQYKCILKGILLGMVLVSSTDVWGSGSVKRGLGISLQQKSFRSRDGQKGVWVTAQTSPMQQQYQIIGWYFSLGNTDFCQNCFSPPAAFSEFSRYPNNWFCIGSYLLALLPINRPLKPLHIYTV